MECTICMEVYASSDASKQPHLLLPCAHTFCRTCVQAVVQQPHNRHCPRCRQGISSTVKNYDFLSALASWRHEEIAAGSPLPSMPPFDKDIRFIVHLKETGNRSRIVYDHLLQLDTQVLFKNFTIVMHKDDSSKPIGVNGYPTMLRGSADPKEGYIRYEGQQCVQLVKLVLQNPEKYLRMS